jgi:chromosomal replication initiation ATPase DnaA
MSAIQGNGRRSEISLARKFVCLALSRFLGMTNSSIAVYVNKDASTVSKALAAIDEELENDRHIHGQWGYICQQMGVSTSFDRNN